ncbi:MAG: ribosome-associated translation inhibitor RaiA [bacterium]|nr:ribosome-associated translation inhibitor RaiA [bacterium]MDN5835116.1 ribosome-associated translation inhibitor RaiA [bacterium]
MITSVDITGVKYDVDENTKKYVQKKIGRLDRFLPRHARKSAAADVRIKQVDQPKDNKYEVEITLTVPGNNLTAKDTAGNALAGIDIVEAKLVRQLHKYKQVSLPHVGRRGMLSKFKRSYDREQ